MSVTYIPAGLRLAVRQRARNVCEYCRVAEADRLIAYHVDHVASEKHGGATITENLALSCRFCNLNKGSDVASFLPPLEAQNVARFYNPRTDIWGEHFAVAPDGATIRASTDIGIATERILRFNDTERTAERFVLAFAGRYPAPDEPG